MTVPVHGSAQTPQAQPAPPIPTPAYPGFPIIVWGSGAASAPRQLPSSASLRDLIGWGGGVPAPLQLSILERIAVAYWGGWLQLGGTVESMTRMQKLPDGSWTGGKLGSTAARPVGWASDPGMAMPWAHVDAKGISNTITSGTVTWGQRPYPKSVDPDSGDGVATAINLYGWGPTAAPAQILTELEIASLSQKGEDRGWLKVQGKDGTYTLNLTDARFAKTAAGTWINRNHPYDDLGLPVAVATKPHHGVAGFIDAVVNDVVKDPLGALFYAIFALTFGPALYQLFAAWSVALGIGAGVAEATGNGQVVNAAASGAVTVAEHPAEVGRIAEGSVLIAGADVLGLPTGGLGHALLNSGVQALGGDQTPGFVPSGGTLAAEAAGELGGKIQKWWQVFIRGSNG